MSVLLHSLLLMTLLDKIPTCNAFPIENHTDHPKKEHPNKLLNIPNYSPPLKPISRPIPSPL